MGSTVFFLDGEKGYFIALVDLGADFVLEKLTAPARAFLAVPIDFPGEYSSSSK
jgi:hypothetical protein